VEQMLYFIFCLQWRSSRNDLMRLYEHVRINPPVIAEEPDEWKKRPEHLIICYV
jgi:hypothetical protein